MKKAIKGARIFCGKDFADNHALLYENEKIIEIVNESEIPKDFEIQNLNGGILSPGFIDLQVNGGGGKLFNNSPDKESLDTIISAHQYFGTTSIMPTVISDSLNVLQKCTDTISQEIDNNKSLLGVHIEGPFFNVKYRGVHQKQYINTINATYMNLFKTLDKYPVMLTLAPECISIKQLKSLKSLGFKILAGHTDANYDQLEEAIKFGLDGFTHLYNAMSGHSSRKSGVLSAALLNGKHAEIICDGYHVSEQAIKIAKKCIPGLYAVSDSISATGLSDGEYNFAGIEIIKRNNIVTIKDSNTLAGSAINMYQTFKNLIQMSFSFEEAVEMTSYNAAKYLNLNNIGLIKENKISNFIVLDNNLNLVDIYFNGKKING